jgi:hypothetical protein
MGLAWAAWGRMGINLQDPWGVLVLAHTHTGTCLLRRATGHFGPLRAEWGVGATFWSHIHLLKTPVAVDKELLWVLGGGSH